MAKEPDDKPKKKGPENTDDALGVPFNIGDFERRYGGIEDVDDEDDENHEHEHDKEGNCMIEPEVVKTYPFKASWKQAFQDMKQAKKETVRHLKAAKNAAQKTAALHRRFWAMVESETQEFSQMRINHDDDVIEVLK